MQTYNLLHNVVLVFKNGRMLYSLPSCVSEKKTPCNTDFFQASAIIVFCIVSTMICSVYISASNERTCSLSSQWWLVLQQHYRAACAGPKPCCCARTWRGSSLPTKRHGAKPVFLKEGGGLEYWAKLLYCFKQLRNGKPTVGCKSVSVLTLHLTGNSAAFKLQPDSLCVVTFWWVLCVQG